MELYIDTTAQDKVQFRLDGEKLTKKVDGLSENLLPELRKFLRQHKVKLSDLTKVSANPGPGGFSSTRTGVATANALAFGLGIPRQDVTVRYDREPSITKPKK